MLARHAARCSAQLRSSPLLRAGVASRTTAAARTARRFSATKPAAAAEPAGEPVVLSFVEDGEEVAVTAAVGQTLLEVAHENDIDLEGACDGSLACSTCHVVLEQEYFDMLPEPEEEEEDMLDLAFGLTDTSRLGCQIKLTKELEGIRATIPGGADNMLPPKG
jgi:2Fe-2S ferredoxin